MYYSRIHFATYIVEDLQSGEYKGVRHTKVDKANMLPVTMSCTMQEGNRIQRRYP